jgi:riboflavin kinase / FMN adenylyltransferase
MNCLTEQHAGAFAQSGRDAAYAFVRSALQQGRPEEAARLIGRYWAIDSRVEHGDARGRTMGFPTANMHLREDDPLAFGVYAVRVGILANCAVASWHDGVANFGIRPMYRITRPLLEAYLLDFDGDLYGRTLRVEFVAYLRAEAAFPSLEALIAQINLDAHRARAVLGVC